MSSSIISTFHLSALQSARKSRGAISPPYQCHAVWDLIFVSTGFVWRALCLCLVSTRTVGEQGQIIPPSLTPLYPPVSSLISLFSSSFLSLSLFCSFPPKLCLLLAFLPLSLNCLFTCFLSLPPCLHTTSFLSRLYFSLHSVSSWGPWAAGAHDY